MEGEERDKIEKLVKQINLGEYNLINELHSLISVPIRHIAYKYLHDKLDAEDLVQDFWAEIYKILKLYRFNKNAYGYLCKVIRNKAIDRYRKLHKHQEVYIDYVDYGSLTNYQNLSIERIELHLMMEQAFKRLTKLQAIIIQAVYFEKCTIREIAKELKMSSTEVCRQKQNAIMILKEHLE